MTDAQNDAIRRVMEIVREHFPASVVIVQGDVVPDESGLLEMGKLHIWNQHIQGTRHPE